MSWVRLPLGANFLEFNGIVLSVVDDAPVDSETPVVTLSISRRFVGLFFKDAHRGKVYARMFIGMSRLMYAITKIVELL
jgi:hypothetical protein